MISLKHLTACKSISKLPQEIDLRTALPFCIDTRRYKHPSAFVAIPGAKVNPLDVISPLLNLGLPLVFFQDDEENRKKTTGLKRLYPATVFIGISDSVTFLQELTTCHIQDWKTKNNNNTVFAISGSNGKTTHKEMLSHILRAILPGKIVATEKNNNNHLGVPLTLMEVTDQIGVVVLELGSNHPGEIKTLCDISRPNAGLTTNIGATHLEFFGTEQNVFEEEGYLYHSVKKETSGEGFYLINLDDRFLSTLTPFKGALTYGETNNAMAKVSYQENGATITHKNKSICVSNRYITGKHNKLNLITCAFIACHFFPQLEKEIIQAASTFQPTKNRSEWVDFQGRPIFLDAYNANPSSMKAALEGFKESVIEKGLSLYDACVVLGDMNELGDSAPKFHREIGKFVKELGFINVFFVGRYRKDYLEGFPTAQGKPSAAEFKTEYKNTCLSKHQIHFIKGSRSLQLESLLDIT